MKVRFLENKIIGDVRYEREQTADLPEAMAIDLEAHGLVELVEETAEEESIETEGSEPLDVQTQEDNAAMEEKSEKPAEAKHRPKRKSAGHR